MHELEQHHPLLNYFAPCPKGLEDLLTEELNQLGVHNIKQTIAGVHFSSDLEGGYRVCLWSRLASRILLELMHFNCASNDTLYDEVYAIDWCNIFLVKNTFAISSSLKQAWSNHSGFVSQKIKDALVDKFRDETGARPSVNRDKPDLRINFFCHKTSAQIYLDLSGNSLHQRGYRTATGQAPLKENLAAAMLIRAGWPELLKSGKDLIDPMCGSATLLVEGAFMAWDQAPGLIRKRWGFKSWKQHDENLWQQLITEAEQKLNQGRQRFQGEMFGFDKNPSVLENAEDNIRRAGVAEIITLKQTAIEQNNFQAPENSLIIVNPPYGERLEERHAALSIYGMMGDWLKANALGSRVAYLSPDRDMSRATGIRVERFYHFYNGQIPVELCCSEVVADNFYSSSYSENLQTLPDDAEQLANRIRKNIKKMAKWLKKENISCYRIYDADLPEFNVAIDCYTKIENNKKYFHVQEYEAPASIPTTVTRKRLDRVLLTLRVLFEVEMQDIFLKQRRKQKQQHQYQPLELKSDAINKPFTVKESNLKFEVNLGQYLDTGLFLDHRPVRQLIGKYCNGKSFLNLFAYTGTATVYAAAANASSTTTVDLSNTYLQWSKRNMQLNGFTSEQHKFIKADCLKWIENNTEKYDVIFLDPPTFSNSKSMETHWDVQKDHEILIDFLMSSLTDNGVMLFSNNFRNFKMSKLLMDKYAVKDISQQTLDLDFKRNQKIHHCFELTHKLTAQTDNP